MESDCRFAEYGAGFWDSGHLRKEDLTLKLTGYCAEKSEECKIPALFLLALPPDRFPGYTGAEIKNNKTIINESEEELVFR